MLYFYSTGRINAYLPPDGIFRPMVLISGIGLMILGVFNLATIGVKDAGCEGHGHDHDCCGGDPDPDHDHDDGHGHDHKHDHDHDHHAHAEGHECCDHGHDHGHSHDHDHHVPSPSEPHVHAHGILEESGGGGRLVAILILAAPICYATLQSPDRYSANAIINKGLYNPNYASTTRADEFTLRTANEKKSKSGDEIPWQEPLPGVSPATTTDLPPATVSTTPKTEVVPKTTETGEAADPQSYGTFTLADLEAQVPKSKAGNFILEVPEIYYTAGDLEVQRVLTGQSVETIAQVMPEKDNDQRLRVFRLLVQCCAADARPYSIPVDFGKAAPEFKEMTWVKIVGKISYPEEGGQVVPLIEASSIEETPEPEDAMIY